MNYKDYIGKRLLMQTKKYCKTLSQVKIIELSPSGKNIRIEHQSGIEFWYSVEEMENQYAFVEVLGDEKPKERLRPRTIGKII